MDLKKLNELRRVYEEETPEEELVEMAMVSKEDYEDGVYDLVIAAIRKRGLEDRLTPGEAPAQLVPDQNGWVEVYRYFDEADKDSLTDVLAEKNIPIDVVAGECPVHEAPVKPVMAAGKVRVPAKFFDAAQKIVADFQHSCMPDGYFVTDELLKKAISAALDEAAVNPKDKIIAAILKKLA